MCIQYGVLEEVCGIIFACIFQAVLFIEKVKCFHLEVADTAGAHAFPNVVCCSEQKWGGYYTSFYKVNRKSDKLIVVRAVAALCTVIYCTGPSET